MQGMDPYTYVIGNPETLTDPTGMSWWDNAWNTVKNVGKTVLDYTTGIPSMINDVGTLFDSHKSWQDKAWAGVDLGFNLLLDASWFIGVGEVVTGARLLIDVGVHIAGDIVGHVAGDVAVHAAAHAVGDAAVHAAAHAAAHAAGDALGHVAGDAIGHAATDTADHAVIDAADHGLGGGGCSFTYNTTVATDHGKQSIGTLQIGEKVAAYNAQTKKMELQPIKRVWINHDDDLVDLTIASTIPTKKGNPEHKTEEVIHTNQKHPFLTQEKGFVPVAYLHAGMHIVQANGSVGEITAWHVVSGSSVMYNLEVTEDHTFTVGDGQWIVHNTGQCTGDLSPGQFTDNTASHTFLDKTGHINEDNPANRAMFSQMTAQSSNYLGIDRFGNHWYSQIESSGNQLWARVRESSGMKIIVSAGRNLAPDIRRTLDRVKGTLIP